MEWRYKIIKKQGVPDTYYALVEDFDGYGVTEALLVGESKKDIHRQLLQMLLDTQ